MCVDGGPLGGPATDHRLGLSSGLLMYIPARPCGTPTPTPAACSPRTVALHLHPPAPTFSIPGPVTLGWGTGSYSVTALPAHPKQTLGAGKAACVLLRGVIGWGPIPSVLSVPSGFPQSSQPLDWGPNQSTALGARLSTRNPQATTGTEAGGGGERGQCRLSLPRSTPLVSVI